MKFDENIESNAVKYNYLACPNHQASLKDSFIRMLQQFGLAWFDDKVSIGWGNYLRLNLDGNEFYHLLTHSDKTGIVGNKYMINEYKTLVCVPSGLEFRLNLEITCDIPEEDMNLYYSLGKVTRNEGHYIEGSVSISCDI